MYGVAHSEKIKTLDGLTINQQPRILIRHYQDPAMLYKLLPLKRYTAITAELKNSKHCQNGRFSLWRIGMA